MRLIDADALIERLKAWDTNDATDKALYNFALNRVLEAPTIGPEQELQNIIQQAAINALRTCQTYLFDTHDKDKKISLEDAEYGIEQLPPVEPKVIACGSGELDVEESDLALDGHALMKAFYDTPEGLQTWSYAWYLFNHAKLAKPKPKRGRWIRQSDPDSKLFGWFICSECGAFIGEEPPYCSNCGADMRGGK